MAISFLGRLRRDEAGNTLALIAAGILPLIGVLGGGLDASRMYLAKSRLQQACDAATLAARKELAGASITNGNIPTNIDNQAKRFFAINFTPGMYGTSNDNFQLTAGSATRMDGTASVEVPTTLMKVFNYDKFSVSVNCSADLNLPNIDVMLVLDQSGSMGGSRIADLKLAVLGFYDEVMAAKPANARVRIGVIPYNSAVNVGSILMAENANYVADSFTYQSREAFFKDEDSIELLPRNAAQLGSSNYAHYHWNENNEKKFKPRCEAYNGTYEVDGETWVITDATWLDNFWSEWPKTEKAACGARITKTVFDYYEYKPMAMDTSLFKLGQTVTTPTGTKGADVDTSWNGCIEERATVATTTFDPIPTGALDLDFEAVPQAGNPDTQWKPMWDGITFDRGGPDIWKTDTDKSTRGFNCPGVARKLKEYPLNGTNRNADFENYINGLTAGGSTMHDIGMVWAARFISPKGIFSGDNATAPNGDPIARHIIFMTDGKMEPHPNRTTAYGNYDMDGRFAGFAASGAWTVDELGAIHNARLDALCQRVKNGNITVWTIAFGLPLNQHTRGCATGENRAFEASNQAQLIAKFREIAGSIAELRLVQ